MVRYMATPFSMRLPQDLIDRIDSARGLIPRTAWIRFHLEEALRSETKPSLDETIVEAEKAVVAAQARPVIEPARRALTSRAAKSGVKPIERG
jgi:hypothetical protein